MNPHQEVGQKQISVAAAIRKSSTSGDFLEKLEQMYQVYDRDLSVRTEIEELPSLSEFSSACISEFVALVEKLIGRIKPIAYGPNEPHLWLVGNIPPTTWQKCRGTCETKACTHSYDDRMDLLIEIAMERQNNDHINKYLSIPEGRPLLRRTLEGGRLIPTLTRERAVVGS